MECSRVSDGRKFSYKHCMTRKIPETQLFIYALHNIVYFFDRGPAVS